MFLKNFAMNFEYLLKFGNKISKIFSIFSILVILLYKYFVYKCC